MSRSGRRDIRWALLQIRPPAGHLDVAGLQLMSHRVREFRRRDRQAARLRAAGPARCRPALGAATFGHDCCGGPSVPSPGALFTSIADDIDATA